MTEAMERLIRLWPLCWRSTLKAERATAVRKIADAIATADRKVTVFQEQRDKAIKDVEVARQVMNEAIKDREVVIGRAAGIQANFESTIRDLYEPWKDAAKKMLRMVQDGRPIAIMSAPNVEYYRGPVGPVLSPRQITTITPKRFSMTLNVGADVGLHNCPPEMVAAEIGDQMRLAILKEWQGDSLLARR